MKLIDISTKAHPNTFTMVDDEDFEWLNQWKWHPCKGHSTTYVVRSVFGKRDKNKKRWFGKIPMHRAILKAPKKSLVDHKNGNGLDNQKSNIRICSRQQNIWNDVNRKNPSKGVRFHCGKYQARITIDGIKHHLGSFDTPEKAVEAYNQFAKQKQGGFFVPTIWRKK